MNNLIKNILFVAFVFYLPIISAQKLIGSSGTEHSGSNGSFSYSVGEPIISTLSNSNNNEVITQGFQQIFDTRTQLTDLDCGSTPSSFTTKFYCNPINDATGYIWEFTDNLGNVHTATRISTTFPAKNDMTFKWASGLYPSICSSNCLPSTPGITYSVRVKPVISNGSFGKVCSITTPCITSELDDNADNQNNNNYQTNFSSLVTSMNTKFWCNKPIGGANGYTWKFENTTIADANFGEIYYAHRTDSNMTFKWAGNSASISINGSLPLPQTAGITYSISIKPDNGCYGDPYDGTTPSVTTELSSNWQGNDYVNNFSSLVPSFGHKFYCNVPPGGTNGYTWKFENISTGDPNFGQIYYAYRSATKHPNSMTFKWAGAASCIGATCLPQSPGIQYNVSIKPNGGSYGTAYPITTPSTTSELSSNWLGNDYVNDFNTLVPSVNHKFYCDIPQGNPNGYYWEFTNTSNGSVYEAYRSASKYPNAMTFGWANSAACFNGNYSNCLPITGGIEYNVRIKPDIIGGVYGTSHTISTPSLLTNVTTTDCAQTTFNWAEKFYCKPVSNAVNYEWKFVDNNNVSYTVLRGNSNTNMTFKWASVNLCSSGCLPNDPGATYDVYVKPIFSPPNSQNFGDFCTLIQGTSKSGIYSDNNSTSNHNLEIYPNPNNGAEFYLNIYGLKSTKAKTTISIFDLNGKIVYNKEVNSESTHIISNILLEKPLVAGIYFIKVNKQNINYIKKMVVQ